MQKTAVAAFQEKPLFGWGTGSMVQLLRSEQIAERAGLEQPINQFDYFHNQYLDQLVQFGLLGFLVLGFSLIYSIYFAIRNKDFLLFLLFAMYLLFMFVESPFSSLKGIQPMIFWICFILYFRNKSQPIVTPEKELKEP